MKFIKFTLACLALLGVSAATIVLTIAYKLPDRIDAVAITQDERVDTEQLIIERLQAQALLVTAQQEVSATITVDRDRALRVGLVSVPLPGHSLTYTMRGTVSLGYDLGDITADSISLGEQHIAITLGQPQIIALDIDPARSSSSTGSVPPEMVTHALQLGREEIKLSLCETEAFALAETQAAVVIGDLLGLTGAQVAVTADRPVCPTL
jgi:hypothetical protein